MLAHIDGATTTATVVGNLVMAAVLLATVAVFLRGGASLPRLATFAAGATVLAVALAPSVDARAESSFSAHMAQHLALTVVAAPLLVLSRPVPPLARGLPVVAHLLVSAERLLTRSSRRAEVVWAVGWCAAFVVGFWAWHVPVAYEAALRHDAVHVAQHVTYVATALGFWWSVLGPLRRRHPLLVGALLFAAMGQGALATLVFAFASRPYYPSYQSRGVGDIQLGGVLMSLSGVVYMVVAVIALASWVARFDRATPAGDRPA